MPFEFRSDPNTLQGTVELPKKSQNENNICCDSPVKIQWNCNSEENDNKTKKIHDSEHRKPN